jgi:phosphate transport system protein
MQLEIELSGLKAEVLNMWTLVESQLIKSKTAMVKLDRDLAREVIIKEKRVNSMELKIDRDCEDLLAIYTPVAIDLRFLLAALKINTNLERIGDIAEGIAQYVVDSFGDHNDVLFNATELIPMFDDAINMLTDARMAFEKEDTTLARSIFKRDEVLDRINHDANSRIIDTIRQDMNTLNDALYVLSIIRKLERVGDQSKNIAEEIIFYVEAKVLKHQEPSKE